MCSLTWLLEDDGYQVFFNRDEQKGRALALAPKRLKIDGVEVVMPIDPVGGGSWISVNEYGLTLCLLNNYQGLNPTGALISRGQLLKSMSAKVSIEGVEKAFYSLNQMDYAPFLLVVFDPALTIQSKNIMVFEWNGQVKASYTTTQPLFSSGVDLDRVLTNRYRTYQSLIETQKPRLGQEEQTNILAERFLEMHKSHHSEELHTSFCMHRSDAHTVSFTHVGVVNKNRVMSYVPGAPCMQLNAASLKRHSVYLESRDAVAS